MSDTPKRDTRRKDLNEKVDKRRRLKYLGTDNKYHWSSGRGASADRQAAKGVQELEKKYGPAGPGDLGDATIAEYFERWIAVKKGDVRYQTWKRYKGVGEKYIVGTIGQVKISHAGASHMQLVVAATNKRKPATRNLVVYMLRAMFNMAEIDGALVKNPSKSAKRKKDDAEKRKAFTEEEEQTIMDLFDDPTCVALPLLYYTGIRRGELYGLQWKFINLNSREITIDQQAHETEDGFVVDRALKTENSRRTIPIPDELVAILRPLRGHRNAFLFQQDNGEHYFDYNIQEMLRYLRRRTGMPELIHHQFRHNYATKLYLAGVPVKEAAIVMGETIEIMMKTYVHIGKQLGDVQKDVVRGAFKPQVAKKLPGAEKST